MKFRTFITVFVIAGFVISFYGRAEAEPSFHSHFGSAGLGHQTNGDESLPGNESHPVTAHKDQHGCYHSHAPLNLPVSISTLLPVQWLKHLTALNMPFKSTIVVIITPPPRA